MRTAVLYYLMRSAYADRPTGAGRHRRINALWEEVRRKFRWSLLSASESSFRVPGGQGLGPGQDCQQIMHGRPGFARGPNRARRPQPRVYR